MIDHTGLVVSDFDRSKRFYCDVFKQIGYSLLMELPPEVTGSVYVAGFGEAQKPDFWISQGTPNRPHVHVAFRVATRKMVDAFHAAALAAGGRDNGKPGPRPHYHENYYGAFALDPDGHNIEAVCHDPAG
jgi:catechol 2,3-dioxygenase-like lactoylglutathione lyase family enzyme